MSTTSTEQLRPLMPAPVRLPAAALAAVAAVVVLVLGVRYHDDASAGRLDRWVAARVAGPRSGFWAHAADSVPVAATVVIVILAVVCCLARRWNLAVLCVAGPVLTIVVTEAGKRVVDRTIGGGWLALPSGHTAGATSVLLVLALVVLARTRERVVAVAGVLFAVVTAGAAAVGLGMVSLHAHYPTDTVAGYCTAVAVTLAVALGIDAVTRERGSLPGSSPRATGEER